MLQQQEVPSACTTKSESADKRKASIATKRHQRTRGEIHTEHHQRKKNQAAGKYTAGVTWKVNTDSHTELSPRLLVPLRNLCNHYFVTASLLLLLRYLLQPFPLLHSHVIESSLSFFILQLPSLSSSNSSFLAHWWWRLPPRRVFFSSLSRSQLHHEYIIWYLCTHSNISNAASFCMWTIAFFNLRLSASTLASCVVGGGALAAAGLIQLGGAFLISCCALSFSGDLLSQMLANDLLLPKNPSTCVDVCFFCWQVV